MAKILTPEQKQLKELNEKRDRVAKEIQAVLDREGMQLQAVQNITILPKKV